MALHQEEWQFVEQWPFAEAVLDATMDDAVLQMMSTRIQSAARGRAARKVAVQKMTALSKWAMARKFAAVALVASVLVLSHQHYADRVPGVRAARPFAALPLLHFGRSTNCTRSDTHAWRFIPSAPHLSHLSHVCSPRSTWMIDTEKSVLENQYLVMQRDKEMEILDVKKGKDGKGGENYYRIKWGKVDATNVHFTWEPESNLPLAKETIDKWWAKPMVLRQNQFL